MVKSVDTADLKSAACLIAACRFESGSGHHGEALSPRHPARILRPARPRFASAVQPFDFHGPIGAFGFLIGKIGHAKQVQHHGRLPFTSRRPVGRCGAFERRLRQRQSSGAAVGFGPIGHSSTLACRRVADTGSIERAFEQFRPYGAAGRLEQPTGFHACLDGQPGNVCGCGIGTTRKRSGCSAETVRCPGSPAGAIRELVCKANAARYVRPRGAFRERHVAASAGSCGEIVCRIEGFTRRATTKKATPPRGKNRFRSSVQRRPRPSPHVKLVVGAPRDRQEAGGTPGGPDAAHLQARRAAWLRNAAPGRTCARFP